jgi:hypothetical protein
MSFTKDSFSIEVFFAALQNECFISPVFASLLIESHKSFSQGSSLCLLHAFKALKYTFFASSFRFSNFDRFPSIFYTGK